MTLGNLKFDLLKTGRFPPVRLEITSLLNASKLQFDKFQSYKFSSNILVPVDAFSFTFAAPGEEKPFSSYVLEGDIATLFANNKQVTTGIVDQIEVDVGEDGEHATVNGRDMMSQLEDNAAVSILKKPMWGKSQTLQAATRQLIEGTRISSDNLLFQDAPKKSYLFSTEPGESRLSALLRFMEPLNVIAWMNPDGKLVIGRPNMAQQPIGTFVLNKKQRLSNVLNMRATFSATSIPNKIVVLYNDVQSSQIGIAKNQIFNNAAAAPSRLRKKGHVIIKAIMVSNPSGADSQSLSSANPFIAAAGSDTLLQAYAKRELARANINECQVQVVVPGHYNASGDFLRPDTVYNIDFDRAGIQKAMYCFAAEWNLTPDRGQFTVLSFCNLGSIVSEVKAP